MGILLAALTGCKCYLALTALILPMIVDGGVQQIFKMESNNIRRLITGIFGGVGIIYLFISIHKFTVWWVTLFLRSVTGGTFGPG